MWAHLREKSTECDEPTQHSLGRGAERQQFCISDVPARWRPNLLLPFRIRSRQSRYRRLYTCQSNIVFRTSIFNAAERTNRFDYLPQEFKSIDRELYSNNRQPDNKHISHPIPRNYRQPDNTSLIHTRVFAAIISHLEPVRTVDVRKQGSDVVVLHAPRLGNAGDDGLRSKATHGVCASKSYVRWAGVSDDTSWGGIQV